MKDTSLHSFHNDEKLKCYVLGDLRFEAESCLVEAGDRIGIPKRKKMPLSQR